MCEHPEGGYSKLLYEDIDNISEECLPAGYSGSRPTWNAIYYLLTKGTKSIFHKIKMAEMWSFHLGSSLELYDLNEEGVLTTSILGNNILSGEKLAYVFPKNHWIAARPTNSSQFSFVNCMTSPGFTFKDWEKAERNDLIKKFPKHTDLIIEFT